MEARPRQPGPLAGTRVLEVANWIAAPSCGALLADLGAEVVKIEPPSGDSMRYVIRQPRSKTGRPQQNGETIDHSFTLHAFLRFRQRRCAFEFFMYIDSLIAVGKLNPF